MLLIILFINHTPLHITHIRVALLPKGIRHFWNLLKTVPKIDTYISLLKCYFTGLANLKIFAVIFIRYTPAPKKIGPSKCAIFLCSRLSLRIMSQSCSGVSTRQRFIRGGTLTRDPHSRGKQCHKPAEYQQHLKDPEGYSILTKN